MLRSCVPRPPRWWGVHGETWSRPMQRREFIKSVIALGGGLAAGPAFSMQAPPDGEVKRVLVMFKCHFDAGFIDTQAAVVRKYFTQYFPQAIRVAEQMRQ